MIPELPSHWKTARVEDISDRVAMGPFGSSMKVDTFVASGVPIISGEHLKGFNLNDAVGYRFITEEHAARLQKANVRKGDVIFTHAGTIGQVSMVPRDSDYERYIISSRQTYIRCDTAKAIPEYVVAYFKSPLGQHDLLANVSAVGVPSISRPVTYLRSVVMPLPPINEQRAIASIFSALDDKIEHNQRTAQTLERVARAIFRAWFVDFAPVKAKIAGATSFPSMPQPVFDALPTRLVESEIGPVPEGWDVKALSSMCTFVSGGTPKRSEPSYWGGDIPWYTIKDAPSDGAIWVTDISQWITKDGMENSAVQVVPKGCTIISTRGTVGKLAMAGLPMAFNQTCYGLLPRNGKSFCHLHLLVRSMVADLQQRTHGSVFNTITQATFDGLLVVSPHGDTVAAFEATVQPLFDTLLALLQESANLAKMRDYLLPKLLSGKVRVEDTHG